MNYMTTIQAAKKWGISSTRITILAKEGRIPEAVQLGARWMIPETAQKPADSRRKEIKNTQPPEPFFRYPAYEGRDPDTFLPPLSAEELQLKLSMEALYACRFDDAERILADLPDRCRNRYCRITALRISCTASIYLNRGSRFLKSYGRLFSELQEDFPRKKEMTEHIHEVDATLGVSTYFSEKFRIDPGYDYHKSYLPHLSALSAVSLYFSGAEHLTPELLKPYELNCRLLDSSDSCADVQSMHLYLGAVYLLLGRKEETALHFRKALELAEKHRLYYAVSLLYYYLEDAFAPVLEGFSAEFREHLHMLSEDIHARFVRFTDTMSLNSLFRLLQHKEYIYILYAVKGYQNKETARLLNVSEKTVSKRYNEIYETLGVKNKAGLVQYCQQSAGLSFL